MLQDNLLMDQQRAFNAHKEEYAGLARNNGELVRKVSHLSMQQALLKVDLEGSSKVAKEHSATIESLRVQLEAVAIARVEAVKNATELQTKANAAEQERDVAQISLQEHSATTASLREQLEAVEDARAKAENISTGFQTKLNAAEQERDGAQASIRDLSTKLATAETALEEARIKIVMLSNEVEDAHEISDLYDIQLQEYKELSKKYDKHLQKYEEMSVEYGFLDQVRICARLIGLPLLTLLRDFKRYRDATKEQKEMRAKVCALEEDIQTQKETADGKIGVLKTEVSQLQTAIELLQRANEELELEKNSVSAEKAINAITRTELSDMKAANTQIEAKLTKALSRIHELEETEPGQWKQLGQVSRPTFFLKSAGH